MKLTGKVALVTGAGHGIGSGIVTRLAEAGADIALAGRNLAPLEQTAEKVRKMGRKAVVLQADVSQWSLVENMVAETVAQLGALDIAVNNAGVIRIKSIEEMTEEDWDFIMNVNARGTFLCCKAEVAVMRPRGFGRIINVSSIAGKEGFPTLTAYSASKFAIVGFTNALAKELAATGITVNAICPGIIATDMWRGENGLANKWRLEGETEEQSWARNQKTLIPQGEAQTPEDMGDLAVYFASSPHVTGQSVNVDGGLVSH
ncbi:MAG: SDR family NAD(P)-dependent oxidoreductase [Desulfovibrio sp.]